MGDGPTSWDLKLQLRLDLLWNRIYLEFVEADVARGISHADHADIDEGVFHVAPGFLGIASSRDELAWVTRVHYRVVSTTIFPCTLRVSRSASACPVWPSG